jgi:hypothetical protein
MLSCWGPDFRKVGTRINVRSNAAPDAVVFCATLFSSTRKRDDADRDDIPWFLVNS